MDHTIGTETSAARLEAGIAIRLNVRNSRISNFAPPTMETQIKAALASLLAAIKAADGQTVADAMAKLDEYVARGRTALHPQLVHFLENRSYAKALMFLGGDTDIPVGAWGGRAGQVKA
jgi:hypothetical protein